MKWNELAPWIAIAFTLALSILVPLFTQIANNHHQKTMQQKKYSYEEKQKKTTIFETFLSAVGGIVTAEGGSSSEAHLQAGSAIHKLYAYAPMEWFDDLDKLTEQIANYRWEDARIILRKLDRLISNELKKETEK